MPVAPDPVHMDDAVSPRAWSDADVAAWLRSERLERFEAVFRDNNITGDVLVELSYELLKELGIYSVSEKVRLLVAIKRLRHRHAPVLASEMVCQDDLHHAILINGQRPVYTDDSVRSESRTLFEARSLEQLPSLGAPIESLQQPTARESESIKQYFIRVIGDEGQSCVVDVRGLNDAASILTAVLNKFHIHEDANPNASYQLFANTSGGSGGETRALSDAELVAICKTTNRPEREKLLILRRRYQPVRHNEFKKKHKNRKLEMFFGEKLPVPQAHADAGGARESFIGGDRPASELISMNLAQYFPETNVDELENVGEIIKRKSMMFELPAATIALAAASAGKRSSTWKRLTASEEAIEEEGDDNREMAKAIPIMVEAPEESPIPVELVVELPVASLPQAVGVTKWLKGALIGTGSFGCVYLGLNAVTGELLAAKQVELPKDGQGDDRKQIMREIAFLEDLNHDNIVRYLGSQLDDSYLNIFLEYVPGGSVSALLANYGAFEEPLVKSYVRQTLEGLSYLHEREIIHRDIKSGNVLVDNKGVIKISDFGISQKVEEGVIGGGPVGNRASLQGSVFWMAPEVVKNQHYTRKADIWSLGCLVIEMFTGDHPFPKYTQMQAIFKIGMDVSPDIPENLSVEAEDFLQRTFELDYGVRPSASDLLLHPFAAGSG